MSPILDPAHVSIECQLGYHSPNCTGVVEPHVAERKRKACYCDAPGCHMDNTPF